MGPPRVLSYSDERVSSVSEVHIGSRRYVGLHVSTKTGKVFEDTLAINLYLDLDDFLAQPTLNSASSDSEAIPVRSVQRSNFVPGFVSTMRLRAEGPGQGLRLVRNLDGGTIVLGKDANGS
jgi:hypothetical protein